MSASFVSAPSQSSLYRERRLTTLLLGWSLLASCMAVAQIVGIGVASLHAGDVPGVISQVVFLLAVLVVLSGSWAYLLPRRAYYSRAIKHRPVTLSCAKATLAAHKPSLTILVPSYKEELQVVRQTLMSAALQDWPDRRVVLLIDDPQHPSDPADLASLQRQVC